MTHLLALETSGAACSVAVNQADEVIERHELMPKLHSRSILPMIQQLLAQAKLKLNEIDAIAFSRGPGSFTGIRIATGVAQGLGFALQIPLLPVSTLAVLAQTAYRQYQVQQVMAVLDAHMKEVYWGYYRLAQGGMCLLGTEGIGAPEELPPLPCDQNGGTWVGAGDGWRLAQRFPEAISARVASVHTDCNPCARDLLLLALSDYQAGRQVSAASAEPAYLRDQSAWRKWRG